MSDSKAWTVIGLWVEDEPVSVGVVEGEHSVYGGSDYLDDGSEVIDGAKGAWAASAVAATAEEAEELAVGEMRASLNDDEDTLIAGVLYGPDGYEAEDPLQDLDGLEQVPEHRNDVGDWCPYSNRIRTADGTCPLYCEEADRLAGFNAERDDVGGDDAEEK
ncbi:MAG TPA: hypothetical protein VGG75_38685 [Trebonia sp.]|jgi:hypothetical protein